MKTLNKLFAMSTTCLLLLAACSSEQSETTHQAPVEQSNSQLLTLSAKQQKDLDGALKDLEYTLNVLNLAESNLSDEHVELKKTINDWLDYYRNLSKQEK
jgi:septal ring factor EnvC (AmiA/AmiB activator)